MRAKQILILDINVIKLMAKFGVEVSVILWFAHTKSARVCEADIHFLHTQLGHRLVCMYAYDDKSYMYLLCLSAVRTNESRQMVAFACAEFMSKYQARVQSAS